MKKIGLSLLVISIFFNGCNSTKHLTDQKSSQSTHVVTPDVAPAPVNFSDQTTWIIGYFDPERLTHYPYSTWYTKGFDEYMPKSEAVNKLLDLSKDEIKIKVVMGIWCPDSRREVPRFMKVLDGWQFPATRITFIGVDDAKKSPVGEYIGLGIVRVPTFIVYKNNVEAGRIIENPVTSLEQDLVNILTGMKNNK
jgi:thiol-disulfide isomerase/thioredoxin